MVSIGQVHCRASSRGFSLVEMMVAMLLGLIVIGGGISVYLASKRSWSDSEQVNFITDNGRFALQLIGDSMRHTRFFGGPHSNDIRTDSSLGAVAGDCSGRAAAYDTDNALFAVRATGATLLGCITDAVAGSDVLVIKGIDPQPLYDSNPDDPNDLRDGVISFPSGAWSSESTYVISNTESGIIIDGADTPPDVQEGQEFALGVAWPYRLQIYYVRNTPNTPTLSRKVLRWDSAASTMSLQTQDLVQGVESLRLLFGYDTGADGRPDTLANLTAVESADRWQDVTSIQAFVLIRSDMPDLDYENVKTYQLGDLTFTPSDNYRRILLHRHVTLRNPRLLLMGGA